MKKVKKSLLTKVRKDCLLDGARVSGYHRSRLTLLAILLRYLSQVRLRRAQNIVQLCVGIGPGVPKVKEQSWTAEGNRTIERSGFPASRMARRALRRPCSIGHDSPSYLSWPLPSVLDSRPCRKPSSISGSSPPPHAFSVRGLSRGGNPLQLEMRERAVDPETQKWKPCRASEKRSASGSCTSPRPTRL